LMSRTVNRQAEEARWFAKCAACHILLICPAFFAWAPWSTAIPVAQAATKYPGQVDPNWRAVHVNHGHPSEWRWGTKAQNPVGYAACSAALGAGLAGFFYCSYRASRCRRMVRAESTAELIQCRVKL
jgi:hypothetical protein